MTQTKIKGECGSGPRLPSAWLGAQGSEGQGRAPTLRPRQL